MLVNSTTDYKITLNVISNKFIEIMNFLFIKLCNVNEFWSIKMLLNRRQGIHFVMIVRALTTS